jgi:peptidoglycan/LPS O-acetylase OafA/YrhL
MKDGAHIDCLDGLRGIAALWVLVGHAILLTGASVAFLGNPDLAVDLFIVLSGFLMAFHYIRRESLEPWRKSKTWLAFWTRRFFRIAPLFYVMLMLALIMDPALAGSREHISAVWPKAATESERYTDQGIANILYHITFAYGFIPKYSFRTPLPDWSIGLEMQFYACLPFIMLGWKRVGASVCSIALGAACLLIKLLLPVLWHSFPMPSFLPAKLPIFLAGMLAAHSLYSASKRKWLLFGIAVALSLLPTWELGVKAVIIRPFFVGALFLLPSSNKGGFGDYVNRVLSTKPMRWLGDVSYGVYLIHLLILIPVASWLADSFGNHLAAPARVVLACVITMGVTYPLAYVMYQTVEKAGIFWGKRFVSFGGLGRLSNTNAEPGPME